MQNLKLSKQYFRILSSIKKQRGKVWAVSLGSLPSFGLWSAIYFLLELTIGFMYVWVIGGLEL
jgi:hypothetical protein